MGRITTHVSYAGVPAKLRSDMLDVLTASYDFVLDIKLRGAFFLAQYVARRMLAKGSHHYRSITFVTLVSAALAAIITPLVAVRPAPHGIGCFELRSGIIGE